MRADFINRRDVRNLKWYRLLPALIPSKRRPAAGLLCWSRASCMKWTLAATVLANFGGPFFAL